MATEEIMQAASTAVSSGHGIPSLAKAFVSAFAEIDNAAKNKVNPAFKNNYADLSSILDTIRPVFATHGLALLQSPGLIVNDMVSVMGLLIHSSGETIAFNTQLPIGPKATAQAAGSAITYARRYQAAAVAGITQVDDDGNHASEKKAPKPGREKTEGTIANDPSDAQDDGDSLLARIAVCETLADTEALKTAIQAFGEKKIADVWAAKRKEIREKVSA